MNDKIVIILPTSGDITFIVPWGEISSYLTQQDNKSDITLLVVQKLIVYIELEHLYLLIFY